MSSTAARGRRGEQLAADYLEGRGWKIVQKNFRGGRGEVDIVAVRDNIVAFVEVKSWDTLPPESLEHGISPAKLQRIVGASREFLARNPALDRFRPQYDVVFVSPGSVDHISNVIE